MHIAVTTFATCATRSRSRRDRLPWHEVFYIASPDRSASTARERCARTTVSRDRVRPLSAKTPRRSRRRSAEAVLLGTAAPVADYRTNGSRGRETRSWAARDVDHDRRLRRLGDRWRGGWLGPGRQRVGGGDTQRGRARRQWVDTAPSGLGHSELSSPSAHPYRTGERPTSSLIVRTWLGRPEGEIATTCAPSASRRVRESLRRPASSGRSLQVLARLERVDTLRGFGRPWPARRLGQGAVARLSNGT